MALNQYRMAKPLWYSLLLAAGILLFHRGITYFIADEQLKVTILDVVTPGWDLLAVAALFWAANRASRQSQRMAQAWFCLGLGQLAWAIGDIIWAYYELLHGGLPPLSLADGFYLIGYPLLILSIFRLPTVHLTWREWGKIAIDLSIVMLTLGLVLWIYWIGPLITSLQQTALIGMAVALAYPLGDLVLLYAILGLLYKQPSDQKIGLYVLLSLNYLLLIALDSLYSYQSVAGRYASGGWLDSGWLFATLNFGLIAIWQATNRQSAPAQSEREGAIADLPFRLNPWLTYLPYVCAILAYLMLERILEGQETQGVDIEFLGASWLTWLVGLIIALVLLRQMLTLRENSLFFSQVRQQSLVLWQTNQALQKEIEERKYAEQARAESEALFRRLFEHSPDAVLLIDPHEPKGPWSILDCNTTAIQMSGYPREELIGRPLELSGLTTRTAAEHAAFLTKLRLADQLKFEDRQQRRDGTSFPIEVSTTLITVNGRELLLGLGRDITERKQAEAQLQSALAQARQSEERYRLLFDGNPQPMWVFDSETLAFLEVNEAAVHHYGYSRATFLTMTMQDLHLAADIPILLDYLTRMPLGQQPGGFWRHRKQDGTLIEVEIISHQLLLYERSAHLVLVYDVTARRTLEEQLRQAQKMETIGQLAGGIAHDFNNLLTGIAGYSELALRRSQTGVPVQRELEQIKKASERATALTSQLLAFSRKQILQPQLLDLNIIVTEMEKMLRPLIGEHIQLRTILASPLGGLQADPGQIEQVIMNLVLNARDAMPHGGELTIETANVDLDEEYTSRHLAVSVGQYIMLAISDTGTGMDSQTQKRIFEPFFTTKEAGKGTGLGLATVYGIVKQSGGHIWVYSEVGVGTVFKVYLPHFDRHAPAHPRAPEREAASRGTETILLAEDEEMVRELACTALTLQGYQVLVAPNSNSALLLGERHPSPIHLLLTDVIMPGLNGAMLATSLASVQPTMKVLYMSGYTDNVIVHQGVLAKEANFIQKPFTPAALAAKVRSVLDH